MQVRTKSVVMAGRSRTIIRDAVPGSTRMVPVFVVDGDAAPEMSGDRGGFFTKAGVPIRHPSAYARKGLSWMVYRCATRVIHVGRKWCEANGIVVVESNGLFDL